MVQIWRFFFNHLAVCGSPFKMWGMNTKVFCVGLKNLEPAPGLFQQLYLQKQAHICTSWAGSPFWALWRKNNKFLLYCQSWQCWSPIYRVTDSRCCNMCLVLWNLTVPIICLTSMCMYIHVCVAHSLIAFRLQLQLTYWFNTFQCCKELSRVLQL